MTLMLNACPEEPNISHILRTGEPLEVMAKSTFKADKLIEVVKLSDENYAEIVENRSKQSDERKGTYEN